MNHEEHEGHEEKRICAVSAMNGGDREFWLGGVFFVSFVFFVVNAFRA
jgi:hypothetical protein